MQPCSFEIWEDKNVQKYYNWFLNEFKLFNFKFAIHECHKAQAIENKGVLLIYSHSSPPSCLDLMKLFMVLVPEPPMKSTYFKVGVELGGHSLEFAPNFPFGQVWVH